MPERCPRRKTADRPTAPPRAGPGPSMTINAVIRLCLARGQADGWDPQRQRELALRVLRRLRPQWSESQIGDAVSRAVERGRVGPFGS
jgi:hypothetical protein